MSSNPGWVELGVRSTSVLSRTLTKKFNVDTAPVFHDERLFPLHRHSTLYSMQYGTIIYCYYSTAQPQG